MKSNFHHKLYFALLLLFSLSTSTLVPAQSVWDGGGDGTSWEDAANWENDILPPADSIVLFNTDAIITGTAVVSPPRITISGGASVVLDLDLNIGNGVSDEHTIVLSSKSTLTLGANNNPTITLNPIDNKQGVASFGSSDSTTLNVASGTTLVIQQGTNGLNFANPISFVNIEGVLECQSGVKNGIKSKGTVINNGMITLSELLTDGIQTSGGTFTNNGDILINKPGEDCIEIIDGAEFINYGTLDLIAKDSAGSGNNAIAVGTAEAIGIFTNEASGMINADGGDKDNGRALYVYEMGTLSNAGFVSIIGGDDGSRFYNRGISSNMLNGTLDLTNGRLNVNLGSFTNNGLVKSYRGSAGIFTGEGTTVTNNAFFKYFGSGNFANGQGTITDNGISLFNSGLAVVDAEGNCEVDIAEVAYDWTLNGAEYASTDATGMLSFASESLSADSATFKTTLDSVRIKVRNVCATAVIPDSSTTSIFNIADQVKGLNIYPSLISDQADLTIELQDFPADNLTIQLFDLNGQQLREYQSFGAEAITVPVNDLQNGYYLLRINHPDIMALGRFVKTK